MTHLTLILLQIVSININPHHKFIVLKHHRILLLFTTCFIRAEPDFNCCYLKSGIETLKTQNCATQTSASTQNMSPNNIPFRSIYMKLADGGHLKVNSCSNIFVLIPPTRINYLKAATFQFLFSLCNCFKCSNNIVLVGGSTWLC